MTILIVENDALHRAFVRQIVVGIWDSPVEIVEAADSWEGVSIARSHSIKHAILDLKLPNGSGVEVARALWARNDRALVIFWSNFADETYVRSLSRIVPPGAGYGYVLKSAPEQEIRSALENVFLEKRRVVDRGIKEVQYRISDRLAGLSDVEYEALVDIALGLTDQVIALRRGLSVRGVQNRLRHLYEKLDIAHYGPADGRTGRFNSRARAVTLALQRGLINFDVLQREEERLRAWLASPRTLPA